MLSRSWKLKGGLKPGDRLEQRSNIAAAMDHAQDQNHIILYKAMMMK